jgi:hypothetical protein
MKFAPMVSRRADLTAAAAAYFGENFVPVAIGGGVVEQAPQRFGSVGQFIFFRNALQHVLRVAVDIERHRSFFACHDVLLKNKVSGRKANSRMSHNAAKNTGLEMLNCKAGLTRIVRSSTLHIADHMERVNGLKVGPCP